MTPGSGGMPKRWHHPRGSLARDGWAVLVDGALPGCQHTGLQVATFAGGTEFELEAGDIERIVVPLAGSAEIEWTDGEGAGSVTLVGRRSVFEGPTDVAYLGAGVSAHLRGAGRIAVASAPTTAHHPIQHLAAADVPVSLRGSGRATRQVHDLGMPGVIQAGRLLVCEVITPAGNWSSYPPHKHDERVQGREASLEEIYYFEIEAERSGPAPGGAAPFALFTAYSSAHGPIEVTERVGAGDVVLVPFGYHGPAAAAPGYDLYYLNVMAGPEERAWRITDDPSHAWVRERWGREPQDPRLPYRRDVDTAEGR